MSEAVLLELGPKLRIEWRLDELMRSADASDPSAPPVWSGELDLTELESLRLISGAAGDEAIAIVVARPHGSANHDEDLIAGVSAGPAGAEGADEVMLSTEYDPDGHIRRLGAELWLADGTGARIAADRSGDDAAAPFDGLSRTSTPLSFRLGGAAGSGLHELLRPNES